MSDCMDDEYDDEDEEMTKLEDEDDEDKGEGSGGGGAQGEDKKNVDFERQLMLKFPLNTMPSKEGIMALHPDITDVEIARAKNPRLCWVEFATREKAEKALEELSKLRVEGGYYITVSWKADPTLRRRYRKDPDNKKRWIMLEGIPFSATADEFKDSVIGVSQCIIGRKRSKRRVPPGSVLLVFNCVKNALEFFEDKKQHVYRGRPVKARFLYENPNPNVMTKKQKRKQARKEYQQQGRKEYEQPGRKEYEQRFTAAHGNEYM